MEDTELDFGEGDYGNGVSEDHHHQIEEKFNQNEAISAVADEDEGFMVEEEDDYEDLYNDVNVAEGLFNNQSIHSSNNNQEEELGFRDVKLESKDDVNQELEKGDKIGELGFRDVKLEGCRDDSVDKDGVLKKSGVPPPVGGGGGGGVGVSGGGGGGVMKVELGNSGGGIGGGEREGEIRNNNGGTSQGVGMQQQHQQQQQQLSVVGLGQVGKTAGVNGGVVSNGVYSGNGNGNGYGGGGGMTTLFVGDLHWWTTDFEVEAEVCKYGQVKEVRFYDEKASGKSKGYCQVEFYEPSAAMACKEGMNGHLFNGKPCVVQLGSTYDIRKLGEAQANKAQAIAQANLNVPPGGRGMSRGNPLGGTYQDGSNGFVRPPWRPSGPMGGRGPGGMNYRGRGRGRGVIGNGVGNGFGQGMGPNQMMHPQAMMGGFDPSYGPNMGRMGGYGFPAAPSPPYPGMMNAYPPVGGAGMTGVAPHVNPAFFGRGMPANGMGMMPTAGMDGQGMGMWPDPSTSGWGGEDPSGRVEESNYGEDAASEHQYGDAGQDRGRPNATKEKDVASERDWSGPPNRKYRDDRDQGSDRDVPREKDGHDYEWPERRPHDDRELSRERERPRERDHDRERERGYDRDRDRDQHREERDRDRVRYREDRDRHVDHHRHKERGSEYEEMDHYRHKDYGTEYDGEWDRGRSSRAYSKSRLPHDEHHRSGSRDIEYSKRRRLPSE